jgi:hypothetical protein
MRQPSLAHLSTDELVDLFEQNAIEQDRVIFKEQISKYKEVFGESDAIYAEFQKRGHDALRALMRLYKSPNMQVRLQAARLTIAVAPAEAQSVLENIARFGHVPQSANARGKLEALGVKWWELK